MQTRRLTGKLLGVELYLERSIPGGSNLVCFFISLHCYKNDSELTLNIDDYPNSPYPTPAFGIVGIAIQTTPLFDLTCPASSKRSIEFSA
jgi:hypothetical protein